MMGAEESGGFGFGMHLPERDGIYADLMLLDLFLRERARGNAPVSRAVELFHELAGPSCYRRIDVHSPDRPPYDAVKAGCWGLGTSPAELAGEAGRGLTQVDGFKVSSDGFLVPARGPALVPVKSEHAPSRCAGYTERELPFRDELVAHRVSGVVCGD
jgi:hypothetical protein